MIVIDAQVHVWKSGQSSPHHSRGRPDPFTIPDLEAEMRTAGVAGAILAPPSWDPDGNDYALGAARAAPTRYAVTGEIHAIATPDPTEVMHWCEQPGMRGLRLNFNTPEKQRQISDGTATWIWNAAERADVPIMLLIPGGVPLVGEIARRHPGLRLCIDHLGIPRGAQDEAAFEHLPALLALARHGNVSVKVGGLPAYASVDTFPYPSLHAHLRRVYDAFGPERMFWASDLTRMSCSYREVVTLFTEGVAWLSTADKRLIMGESVCRWLRWHPGHPGGGAAAD